MTWVLNEIDEQLVDLALQEDLLFPYRDVTSEWLFAKNNDRHTVKVVSKEKFPVRVCGIPLVHALMRRLDPAYELTVTVPDGSNLLPGETLCTLSAHIIPLLQAERALLNFLRHLCAVATLTAKFVAAVAGTELKILDTRKTMPGMRHLEKYAVFCGGGVNHRMGLYDAIMVKNNHVDLLGGMKVVLAQLPVHPAYPVIVEVRSLAELEIVLQEAQGRVTRVLLDNMSPTLLAECVSLCDNRIETEASGNLQLATILDVARTGVHYASVGALTHSCGTIDLSLRAVS